MTDKPTVADYKLGQTLIFTSLTQASAAADLWGKDALDTWDTGFNPEWCKGFKTFIIYHSGKFVGQAKQWCIVLDTEEKIQWFVPQVGDLVGFDGEKNYYTVIEGDSSLTTFSTTEIKLGEALDLIKDLKIILRNGKPFPTPQDVIEPEETV